MLACWAKVLSSASQSKIAPATCAAWPHRSCNLCSHMIKHSTSWSFCCKSDRQPGFLVYNAQINSSDATGLTAGGNKRKSHGVAKPVCSRENQAPSSTHHLLQGLSCFPLRYVSRQHHDVSSTLPIPPRLYHGYRLRANDVCQECLPYALISLTSHTPLTGIPAS